MNKIFSVFSLFHESVCRVGCRRKNYLVEEEEHDICPIVGWVWVEGFFILFVGLTSQRKFGDASFMEWSSLKSKGGSCWVD